MPINRSDAIQAAIAARLQGITVAGGYSCNVRHVERGLRPATGKGTYPALFVWTASSGEDGRKHSGFGVGDGAFESAMDVGITGFMRGPLESDSAASNFVQDIVRAVQANPKDLGLLDGASSYVLRVHVRDWALSVISSELESSWYVEVDAVVQVVYRTTYDGI
jgi:hypothetical protein